jgi:hypothetical protein
MEGCAAILVGNEVGNVMFIPNIILKAIGRSSWLS